MKPFTEEDIFRYLDGHMTPGEREAFKGELAENPMLKGRYDQLQAIHQTLKEHRLEPSPEGITENVMSSLEQNPIRQYQGAYFYSGTGFLLVLGILTALVAVISLFNSGYLHAESIMPMSEGKPFFEEWVYLKSLLTKKMLTNIMLVIYGVLALTLLDRAVFYPFFRKKTKQYTY